MIKTHNMPSRGVGKLRTRFYKDSYKSSAAKGHDSACSCLGGVTLLRARQGGVQPYTTSINRVICGTHHRNPSAHSRSHPDAVRIHGMILISFSGLNHVWCRPPTFVQAWDFIRCKCARADYSISVIVWQVKFDSATREVHVIDLKHQHKWNRSFHPANTGKCSEKLAYVRDHATQKNLLVHGAGHAREQIRKVASECKPLYWVLVVRSHIRVDPTLDLILS